MLSHRPHVIVELGLGEVPGDDAAALRLDLHRPRQLEAAVSERLAKPLNPDETTAYGVDPAHIRLSISFSAAAQSGGVCLRYLSHSAVSASLSSLNVIPTFQTMTSL